MRVALRGLKLLACLHSPHTLGTTCRLRRVVCVRSKCKLVQNWLFNRGIRFDLSNEDLERKQVPSI